MDAGADVNIPGGDNAQHAHCDCDIARLLLAAGANVHPVDIHHNTALHYDAQHGHHHVLEVLLRAGC